MRACTFFGHRECPEEMREVLLETIAELVRKEKVEMFYVGNQGRFDQLVLSALRTLKSRGDFPVFEYAVVLAYYPDRQSIDEKFGAEETLLPERQELVHPRFAIDRRNRWMIGQSEVVIAWVEHSWGGAAKYTALAQRKGKRIRYLEIPPKNP